MLKFSRLTLLVIMGLTVSACSQNMHEEEIYTAGFNWERDNNRVSCDGLLIDPLMFLMENQGSLRGYLRDQGLADAGSDVDLSKPNSIGFKQVQNQKYVRFNFATLLETAPLQFDGGVTVTVEMCSGRFVFAGVLAW